MLDITFCYLWWEPTVTWLSIYMGYPAQKMKFAIKYLFSKYDQICRKLQIWSHLLKKSLIENFTFCAVIVLIKLIFGVPEQQMAGNESLIIFSIFGIYHTV